MISLSRRSILLIGLAALLVLSAVVGISLHTLTEDAAPTTVVVVPQPKPRPLPPQPKPPAPLSSRSFQSVALPGPLTKLGAERRVLGDDGIAAVPASLKPAITGVAVGGLIRQDTHAICYLNASATARHCTLTVRRGIKPWTIVEFRVDAIGTHYLSATYWA